MAYRNDHLSDDVRGGTRTHHCAHSLLHWLVVVSVSVLTGCATSRSTSRALASGASDAYEQSSADPIAAAFRAGMEAGLNAYAEHYLDNDFPYYNWSTPLVQRTWMPPRITGGVFYPGHMAEVLITPGAWKREYAAPISSRRGVSAQRQYLRERPAGDFEDDGPPDGPFPSAGSSAATPLRPWRYSTTAVPAQNSVPGLPPAHLQRGEAEEPSLEPQTRSQHPRERSTP